MPVTLDEAKAFVREHHRHNDPPVGWNWGVGLEDDDGLVGVAMVGRTTARGLHDRYVAEVTRCTTTGEKNACSMLYGACARAAKAMGYGRLYTYTLADEPGTSLLAAGWVRDAEVPAAATWARPTRPRYDTNLFGEAIRPNGPKVRWRKDLVRVPVAS